MNSLNYDLRRSYYAILAATILAMLYAWLENRYGGYPRISDPITIIAASLGVLVIAETFSLASASAGLVTCALFFEGAVTANPSRPGPYAGMAADDFGLIFAFVATVLAFVVFYLKYGTDGGWRGVFYLLVPACFALWLIDGEAQMSVWVAPLVAGFLMMRVLAEVNPPASSWARGD